MHMSPACNLHRWTQKAKVIDHITKGLLTRHFVLVVWWSQWPIHPHHPLPPHSVPNHSWFASSNFYLHHPPAWASNQPSSRWIYVLHARNSPRQQLWLLTAKYRDCYYGMYQQQKSINEKIWWLLVVCITCSYKLEVDCIDFRHLEPVLLSHICKNYFCSTDNQCAKPTKSFSYFWSLNHVVNRFINCHPVEFFLSCGQRGIYQNLPFRRNQKLYISLDNKEAGLFQKSGSEMVLIKQQGI